MVAHLTSGAELPGSNQASPIMTLMRCMIIDHCKKTDIRTLAEFWHWFVANIPGDAVDEGDVIFDLLFPLVLPEGSGDHR